MRRQGGDAGVDQDRHGDGLDDDVGRDAGHAHAEDDGHDHDEEACQVDAAVVHDGQDQVAHVQAHAGERDRADDDTDDDAADPDGNGALGAFRRGGDNLVPAHARIFAQPAGHDGGENGNDGRQQRRIPGEHQPDEGNQRQDQMSLFLQDFRGLGDVFPGQAGKAQTFRFKVDGEEQSQIIQESGHDGRHHDDGVAQVQEFRHDEAHGAHDGRAELASRRRDGFDGAGEFFPVARAFHQGNRDGSRGRHVRDGRSVDHA